MRNRHTVDNSSWAESNPPHAKGWAPLLTCCKFFAAGSECSFERFVQHSFHLATFISLGYLPTHGIYIYIYTKPSMQWCPTLHVRGLVSTKLNSFNPYKSSLPLHPHPPTHTSPSHTHHTLTHFSLKIASFLLHRAGRPSVWRGHPLYSK